MRRTIMVWGCTSGAGKSLLATALCRWASNAGLDVAPYKAQNMSNNARVVTHPDGGGAEIGSAQAIQALAARVRPGIDHNPVLLKPERDTASQVVVDGRVAPALSALPWRERSELLATAARAGFERLAARHEVIVVEGAGSPAEINLAAHDYVNLGTARWARDCAGGDDAAVQALLIADIDRGGAFAHCHGTWALLPPDLRPLLRGYVLNRFRGDAALLAPGPALLEAATGVPVLGVLPWWRDLDLPEEDGLEAAGPLHVDATALQGSGDKPVVVAIVAGPHLSNVDEFQPLRRLSGVVVRWVREPSAFDGADWIVLPGSKQVSGDLQWLRAQGLEAPIRRHVTAGRPLLGVCGGLQMLGELLDDPDGADGVAHGPLPGLGLLPLATRHALPKRLLTVTARFGTTHGPWAALAGLAYDGYEIRCGRTEARTSHRADDGAAVLHASSRGTHDGVAPQAIGWQRGPVLGVYAHGLFESPAVLRALFGAAPPPLDDALDRLAARLEAALGRDRLEALFDRRATASSVSRKPFATPSP